MSSSKKKKGVKRTRESQQSYLEEALVGKKLWTMKVLAYAQQDMIDAMAIVLNVKYGFGPERQKQFHDDFEEVYGEIQDIRREDREDGEYSRAKVEQALKKAHGKYYVPYDERYIMTYKTASGKEYRL